jgi:hypothetical protein
VGEIGFSYNRFLFGLLWWEIKSIIRGYNARHHHGWEQARLIAYQAHYCMGLPKGETAPLVTEWLKFPWEKEQSSKPLTDDERSQLQAEMDAMNAELAKQKE